MPETNPPFPPLRSVAPPPAGKRPRHLRLTRVILTVGVLSVVAFIVLNCTGMVFPILGRQSDLEGWLKSDFGVALPASAVVDNGDRFAYRDPERRYAVKMASADVAKLVAAVKAAAVARGASVSDDTPATAWPTLPRPPVWWPTTVPADARDFGVLINGDIYSIVYSDSAGRVWIVRQST